MIAEGSTVSIEFTPTLDDGSTVDSNVGEDPLIFEQGRGGILPALEEALLGLQVDDVRRVTLPPEQGFGSVDPEAFDVVPLDAVPASARQVGMQLVAEDQGGSRRPVRIHEVRAQEIVIDLNHPLAGQTLHFEVRILAIQ